MIRQVTTIDGELAIKIKKDDNLKFNDLVYFKKVDSKSHKYKKLPTNDDDIELLKLIKKEVKK